MMKSRKKQQGLVLLLFLGFLVTGLFVNGRMSEANGQLYVFTCKPYGTPFTLEAMERMKNAGYEVGYCAETKLPAQSYRTKKPVRIVGTNENYPYLAERNMREGAWFNGFHAEQQRPIAVLNEAAAMEFFGTTHAQLNRLHIDGVEYTILGVVGEAKEGAVVYLPYKNLRDCHRLDLGIQQVYSRLENASEAKLLLELSGMEEQEIEVFSMFEYQTATRVRWCLLLFLIGILLAIWLWKGIRKEFRNLKEQGSKFLNTQYGMEVWKLCLDRTFCMGILRFVGRGLLVVLLGYWILHTSNFNLGTGRYITQMKVSVSEFSYLETWNMLSQWLFFFTLLTGMLLWKERFGMLKNSQNYFEQAKIRFVLDGTDNQKK